MAKVKVACHRSKKVKKLAKEGAYVSKFSSVLKLGSYPTSTLTLAANPNHSRKPHTTQVTLSEWKSLYFYWFVATSSALPCFYRSPALCLCTYV